MLEKRFAVSCAALLIAACTTGAARADADQRLPDASLDMYAQPGQLVDIGAGRKLDLRCGGSGAPTVLLDIGAGMTSMSWRKVQPLVAKHQRVCSYDRAGFGFSDPGPLPRTAAAEAADLHALVRAAKLETPLILVGHSLASYIVRLEASAHPREVAGLVLVDPVSETLADDAPAYARREAQAAKENGAYARQCADAARKGMLENSGLENGAPEKSGPEKSGPATAMCVPPPYPGLSAKLSDVLRNRYRHAAFWDASVSEHESDVANIAAVKAARLPKDMPLVVLSAQGGRDWVAPADRKVADAAYAAGHRRIAAQSTRGVVVKVEKSSHDMQEDRPDAIAAAIGKVDAMIGDPAPMRR